MPPKQLPGLCPRTHAGCPTTPQPLPRRCTDVEGIKASGLDLPGFIRTGVVSGLRQLLEFGLFHGDPHPGNIFALRDGRIAYVDFGNVAELSQRNKEVGADGCGWGHGWVLGGVVDWLAGWLAYVRQNCCCSRVASTPP